MLIGFVQFQGKINFILAYNKRIKRHIKFFSFNWNRNQWIWIKANSGFMRDGLPADTLYLLLAIYWWGAIIALGIKTFEKKIPPITILRIHFKHWVTWPGKTVRQKFDSLFRIQYQVLVVTDIYATTSIILAKISEMMQLNSIRIHIKNITTFKTTLRAYQ